MNASPAKSEPTSARPLVDVRRLCVQFDSQQVLRDVSLAVPRGQTVAVIGESGCGKTVLLKSMIGLVRPTSGTVSFDGRDLAGMGEKELAALRVRFGFLFQGAALFDSMTVADNFAFPLRQHTKKSEREITRLIDGRLEDVGLTSAALTKRPAELSGGMRKRVGLARALVMDPEIMLYDEPTTGLDPIMSDVINELILRQRRIDEDAAAVTNVIVTHDMRTVRKVADRAVMIVPATQVRKGESQIIFDGPAAELDVADDARVRQFVEGHAGGRITEETP